MVLHDFIVKNQSEKQLSQQETIAKLEWCLEKCDEIYKQVSDHSKGSNHLRDSIGSRHSSLNSANNSVSNPFVTADQTNPALRLSQVMALKAQLKPEVPQPVSPKIKTELNQLVQPIPETNASWEESRYHNPTDSIADGYSIIMTENDQTVNESLNVTDMLNVEIPSAPKAG